MRIVRRFITFPQYKDQLMAVGRARQTGIEVPGLGILSAGKFEEHAGSKLHRPNQHTLAPSGKSLQVKCLQTWHLHSSPLLVCNKGLAELMLQAQAAGVCCEVCQLYPSPECIAFSAQHASKCRTSWQIRLRMEQVPPCIYQKRQCRLCL